MCVASNITEQHSWTKLGAKHYVYSVEEKPSFVQNKIKKSTILMVTYGFSTVMKKGSNAKQRFGNILGSDCKDKIKKIF